MFDAAFRSRLEEPLDRFAGQLADRGISPNAVTAFGLALGVGCCVAIGFAQWWVALALWILNRLADGFDGPLARRLGATDFGGFFDIMADFTIYGGVLVALGIALPETRLAALFVLFMYYLSGSSFLAFSSLAMKRQHEGDGRSLVFPAGLAEGSETIAAYIVILVFPGQAEGLLWIWGAIVAVTVVQRLFYVRQLLN